MRLAVTIDYKSSVLYERCMKENSDILKRSLASSYMHDRQLRQCLNCKFIYEGIRFLFREF